jgi:hypothetical protein
MFYNFSQPLRTDDNTIITNPYVLGLVAAFNPELLLTLLIIFQIWQDSLDGFEMW